MDNEGWKLQNEETMMTELLENINAVIKDSDAVEEKEMIQNLLNNGSLSEQRESMGKIKDMLSEWKESFLLRKKQYEADEVVLQNVNGVMDTFQEESKGKINRLKEDLREQISEEINMYQDEVIAKLNPKKVKENFPGGSEAFLKEISESLNEEYRKKMIEHVEREIERTIVEYTSELDEEFDEATGYFRKRKSLIKLEDKFYGSLGENKDRMIENASRSVGTVREYYRSLTEASEESFIKIWQARNACDQKIERGEVAGAVTGGITGGGVVMGAKAFGVLKSGAAVATALTPKALLAAGVFAFVGGIALKKAANKVFTAKGMEELEVRTREFINEFKMEVSNTKNVMTEQITTDVGELFLRELSKADKVFLDFRMSVNIDSRNIPVLEEKINKIQVLMEKMAQAAIEEDKDDRI